MGFVFALEFNKQRIKKRVTTGTNDSVAVTDQPGLRKMELDERPVSWGLPETILVVMKGRSTALPCSHHTPLK